MYCNTLQHAATHCNTLHHTATHGNTRQHTATHCHIYILHKTSTLNSLTHSATHCITRQHTTTHLQHTCNTLATHRHNYVSRKRITSISSSLAHTVKALRVLGIQTPCNTLQHAATHCNTLQHAATRCNTLQHAATRCNTLQHAATHCNTQDIDFQSNSLAHTVNAVGVLGIETRLTAPHKLACPHCGVAQTCCQLTDVCVCMCVCVCV